MDIDQYKLTVFCTVVETTSITKAADILYLTQPAVSISITALENIFESRLINRDQFGADRLTTAGEVFYRRAKEILRLHALAKREIMGMNRLMRDDVRIGACDTFENHILPCVVSDFSKRRPNIKLGIKAGETKWITNLLLAGDIDIGITDAVPVKKKVFAEPLLEDEVFVIVSPRHPWADLKSVSIRAAAKRPLILRAEGTSTRLIVDDIFSSNGISCDSLNIPLVLTSPVAIFDAVESGLGISFASRWEIRNEARHKRLVPIALEEGNPTSRFYLTALKNALQSREIREFIQYLKSYPYELKCRFNRPDTGVQPSKKQLVQTNPPGYDPDKIFSIQS